MLCSSFAFNTGDLFTAQEFFSLVPHAQLNQIHIFTIEDVVIPKAFLLFMASYLSERPVKDVAKDWLVFSSFLVSVKNVEEQSFVRELCWIIEIEALEWHTMLLTLQQFISQESWRVHDYGEED